MTTERNNEIENGMSISEARKNLSGLLSDFAYKPRCISLTRYGEPVMALMPWELFESMRLTMEIMSDPGLVEELRESIMEIKEGRTRSLAEFKAELDL